MHWIYIFIGGGLGSILRYALTFIPLLAPSVSQPVPTLIANLLASLILGYFSYISIYAWDIPPSVKLGLTVGLCGGLSTFSTFTAESFKLLENGQWILFFSYAAGSLLLCLAGFLLGMKLGGA